MFATDTWAVIHNREAYAMPSEDEAKKAAERLAVHSGKPALVAKVTACCHPMPREVSWEHAEDIPDA